VLRPPAPPNAHPLSAYFRRSFLMAQGASGKTLETGGTWGDAAGWVAETF
jgi:hypothetical protein